LPDEYGEDDMDDDLEGLNLNDDIIPAAAPVGGGFSITFDLDDEFLKAPEEEAHVEEAPQEEPNIEIPPSEESLKDLEDAPEEQPDKSEVISIESEKPLFNL
jgi:hypothetical protein